MTAATTNGRACASAQTVIKATKTGEHKSCVLRHTPLTLIAGSRSSPVISIASTSVAPLAAVRPRIYSAWKPPAPHPGGKLRGKLSHLDHVRVGRYRTPTPILNHYQSASHRIACIHRSPSILLDVVVIVSAASSCPAELLVNTGLHMHTRSSPAEVDEPQALSSHRLS